jgi:opacity protein-like surface antigen
MSRIRICGCLEESKLGKLKTQKEKSSMKLKTAFVAASLLVAGLVSAAWAADVSGKWVAQVPGRDGSTREVTINLKADGGKLTGTISGRQADTPISDGKVSGDDISFTVVRNVQGTDMKFLYKGKVKGDEIAFTVNREGGDQPGQQFTAKKAK